MTTIPSYTMAMVFHAVHLFVLTVLDPAHETKSATLILIATAPMHASYPAISYICNRCGRFVKSCRISASMVSRQ